MHTTRVIRRAKVEENNKGTMYTSGAVQYTSYQWLDRWDKKKVIWVTHIMCHRCSIL